MITEFADRLFFPYCLQRVKGDVFVVVNRDYRAISLPHLRGCNQEDRSILEPLVFITPVVAARLSVHGCEDIDVIYFFDDATAPWRNKRNLTAYQKRISFLIELCSEQASVAAKAYASQSTPTNSSVATPPMVLSALTLQP